MLLYLINNIFVTGNQKFVFANAETEKINQQQLWSFGQNPNTEPHKPPEQRRRSRTLDWPCVLCVCLQVHKDRICWKHRATVHHAVLWASHTDTHTPWVRLSLKPQDLWIQQQTPVFITVCVNKQVVLSLEIKPSRLCLNLVFVTICSSVLLFSFWRLQSCSRCFFNVSKHPLISVSLSLHGLVLD